jgi:arginase
VCKNRELTKSGKKNLMPQSRIKILGVPLDLGQTRRGVDMGPSALRAAGLQMRLRGLGHQVEEAGNVPVVIPETHKSGDDSARYLKEIADVCKGASKRVAKFLVDGWIPLVLGGDHSIAVGTVAGASQYYGAQRKSVGLIWLDAHPDINTPETTPSGNVHGMPLAAIVGLGPARLAELAGKIPMVDPRRVALVGVRRVDTKEKENIQRAGLHLFTMRDIDEQGMRKVMEQAIAIASKRTAGFHVSLDMDFVDPSEAPGVGTPCPGGVTYREAHLAMEMIADSGKMRSLEIVEVNPILDTANRTASLAVELAMSGFGKRIV